MVVNWLYLVSARRIAIGVKEYVIIGLRGGYGKFMLIYMASSLVLEYIHSKFRTGNLKSNDFDYSSALNVVEDSRHQKDQK